MDLSAVSSALQTISGPLIQEVISLWGVKDEVESLERELKWMQSFLKDADAVKVADFEVIRTYIAEVRELAYDAEDVIETFALKVASKRKGGFSGFLRRSACCLKEGCLLRKTKSEIGRITGRITELSRRLQTYDVKKIRDEGGPSSSNDQRRESRRPYPHIIEDNIVGLDDDIRNVVSILVDEEHHHDRRVVSICGMGGLGKTTLAKKVYNDSQIRSHFNHLAWVYVSQQCQKRKVWEDILSALNLSNKMKRDEELAEELFNTLQERKCLVILDDIWSTEAWDSIKPAFPTRETSSKILLTSRNKEVVSHADRRGYLYELQCLKDEQSWELFQRIAFPESDSTDKTVRVESCMEELGKGMIKHCAGLPLAIIVLGGILASKCSVIEWQKVSKNVKRYLMGGKGHGVEHVLDLSYDDMPPYLRPCFLYLSHFPEDYKIETDRLIQLWIAEGFVSIEHDEVNGGETLEDEAECYLIELMERYMIQAEERDFIGNVKTCRMHDVIRDACLSKAKQEKFIHIIDHSNADNDYSSPLAIGKVPRVAAHKYILVQRLKNPHLRSLVLFSEIFRSRDNLEESFLDKVPYCLNDFMDGNDCVLICFMFWFVTIGYPLFFSLLFCSVVPEICCTWKYMLNNFKLLRVLYFEGEDNFGGCKLPGGLGNLIHLRFLSLRNFDFILSKLPSCLGNLECLRTLDLRLQKPFDSRKIHVPNVLWKLRQLRHLYLPSHLKRQTRLRLDTLVNLHTLVNFNIRSCDVAHLLSLINLRKLEILWIPDDNYEANFEKHLNNDKNPQIIASINLKSLSFLINQSGYGKMDPTHLMHLFSICVNIYEFSLRVKMSKLPQHHHFPSDMAYVSLHNTLLEEDPMPTLEKLPNLRILHLGGSDAFTGKEMVCSAQGFPKLDSLIIGGLDDLEEWKVEEGAMLALRHLEISRCEKLEMLPEGLRFIATLQELKITKMPKTFQEKLVQGGEDFHKVQHIPSIII